jgi:hypothetical protein
MENIKFYYLEDEYEPKIIMADEDKQECFSIDRLDLTSIEKIDYPSNDVLNEIINESISEGFNGSWLDIKFVLDEPKILENLVNSNDRDKYIELIKDFNSKQETVNDILIERFWERFENQSSKIAEKYIKLYEKCVQHIKSLNNVNANDFFKETKELSDKEYFYSVIKLSNVSNVKINENHFSF